MANGKETDGWADRVKAAMVTLPERGGRGVLVPGGFVLTATHWLRQEGSAGLVLEDHHAVPVEAGGYSFRLGPWFADAVSDTAVLGSLDTEVFPDDRDIFDKWRNRAVPVPLSPWIPKIPTLRPLLAQTPGLWDSRPARILSPDGRWRPGRVINDGLRLSPFVVLQVEEPIEGETSGGPIVDTRGRLFGVFTWGAEHGGIPVARLALPAWLLGLIAHAARH